MEDQRIVTPYFLDQPVPEFVRLGHEALINAPPLPPGDVQGRMGVLHNGLADLVERVVRAGRRPVSLAGDCCTTIGVAAGLQRAGVKPALIWFDAHGDYNTWDTTPSGFLGGMPLAMLVGRGEQRMLEAVKLTPLQEASIILTDARDLDPGEAEALAGSKVRHVAQVSALDESILPDQPLFVHFDVDILNPEVLPAVSYPAPGGPGVQEISQAFRMLSRSGRVSAISLSAWNPKLDPDGATGRLCLDLLRELTTTPT